MKYHVTVLYDTYHSREPAAWLKKHGVEYKCTSVMDNTPVGMSFLYSFNSAEDASAFRLKFV